MLPRRLGTHLTSNLRPCYTTSTTRLKTLIPVQQHHPQLQTMKPMSQFATSVITTVVAASVGYYIGKTSGLRKSDNIHDLKEVAKVSPAVEDNFTPPPEGEKKDGKGKGKEAEEWESEEESDEDSGAEDGISGFEDLKEECKMVLVVRTDLGMTKGKIAAQCGHATLMCYKAALRHAPELVKRWETWGQTKVAVQCKGGEEELLTLQATALSLGVTAKIVHDAGRTQIASGSATVLGLGPAPRSVVDQISGGLKLL